MSAGGTLRELIKDVEVALVFNLSNDSPLIEEIASADRIPTRASKWNETNLFEKVVCDYGTNG
jgi:hypothetical protein